MWRRCWAGRLALAAALAALAGGARAENEPLGVFPETEQVFRQLIADPRHIQLSASYYRLGGRDVGDVALGHAWGMARWHTNDNYWTWQWNLEAMAYSRFTIGGSLNDFETVDFFGNLPVAIRHDAFSARLMLFHESSHLGDDYIRRTRDLGFRYSIDGLRSTVSYEPWWWLRVYGGGTYLLHTIPSPARRALQTGFELKTHDLGLAEKYPVWLFLAQDIQSHENVQWNVNSRTIAGIAMGAKDVPRYMKLHVGYFDGHSPYGQFFFKREHYADMGLSLHF